MAVSALHVFCTDSTSLTLLLTYLANLTEDNLTALISDYDKLPGLPALLSLLAMPGRRCD